MTAKKLKLELEDIRVESFESVTERAMSEGTVQGLSGPSTGGSPSGCQETCGSLCSIGTGCETICGGETCQLTICGPIMC